MIKPQCSVGGWACFVSDVILADRSAAPPRSRFRMNGPSDARFANVSIWICVWYTLRFRSPADRFVNEDLFHGIVCLRSDTKRFAGAG